MSFRSVLLESQGRLGVKDGSLFFRRIDDEVLMVPLDDIHTIIIEDRRSVVSSHALSYFAEKGIVVFFCDEKHLPNAVCLAFQSFSRQRIRIEDQISAKKTFYKKLWAKIIQAKILNQSLVLKKLNIIASSNRIQEISKQVLSGDKDNREGYASQIYFQEIFGERFNRRDAGFVNSLLNYGYAIVRGYVAREIVGHGLIPSIGIFHKNQYNNFNLADDLMEPFRPFVDLKVISLLETFHDKKELDKDLKKLLIEMLSKEVVQEQKIVTIKQSIDITVNSFVSSLVEKDPSRISLPKLEK